MVRAPRRHFVMATLATAVLALGPKGASAVATPDAQLIDSYVLGIEEVVLSVNVHDSAASKYGLRQGPLLRALGDAARRLAQMQRTRMWVAAESTASFYDEYRGNRLTAYQKQLHINVEVGLGEAARQVDVKIRTRRARGIWQAGPYAPSLTTQVACHSATCASRAVVELVVPFFDLMMLAEDRLSRDPNKMRVQ